jgi:hypothetical protein
MDWPYYLYIHKGMKQSSKYKEGILASTRYSTITRQFKKGPSLVLVSTGIRVPVIRTTLVNTSTSNHEKHGKVWQHWRKKRKKPCVRIKRVKSDSYLTYGQSCKAYMELYVDTPPPKKNTNKLILWRHEDGSC